LRTRRALQIGLRFLRAYSGFRRFVFQGQGGAKRAQLVPILIGQFYFQSTRQSAFYATFPTRPPVVKIRATAGQFASGVYPHTLRRADYPKQGSLGQGFAAANTGSLRHMLYAFRRLLRHLSFSTLFIRLRETVCQFRAAIIE
jgi:hypothetical protein